MKDIASLELQIKKQEELIDKLKSELAHEKAESQIVKDELNSSKEILLYSLASMGAYYWVDDLVKGTVKYLSKDFFTNIGYLESEIPSTLEEYITFVHPDDIGPVMDTVGKYCKGTIDKYEAVFRYRKKDGSWLWTNNIGFGSKIENGEVIELSGITTDITQSKEQQNAIETLLEKQKEMFAIIGHELRTPVATIDMVVGDTAIAEKDRLLQIKHISQNLLQVLEDLRTVVAPERALETKRESADPVSIVENTLSSLKHLATNAGLALNINIHRERGRLFAIHGSMLRQVITNLVKNAVLHSEGSKVFVDFGYEVLADGSGSATLVIEDNGKGIPENKRQKIFEAFSRGDTSKDGSGLGLHIVRELVQRMEGSITCSTSQYGGACFTLSIPLEESDQTAANELSDTQRMSLNGVRVLLAEDDAVLRTLTERLLVKQGATVTSCSNGLIALQAFTPENFDLILTDLVMPEMDGHKLTREIRSQGIQTPIIAVTAAVIGEETDQIIAEGAEAVIPKPISVNGLIATLEKIQF